MASVLTLNLENSIAGYEESKFINLCFISKRLIHVTQNSCSIKKIWQLNFLSKKLIRVKEKVCLRFELFKNF